MIDLQKVLKENKELKKKKSNKDSKDSAKKLLSKLSKTFVNKPIVKPSNASIEIKETEPAEYKSRFFKNEWEETKKSMFWK